jgi:hypothetical protein
VTEYTRDFESDGERWQVRRQLPVWTGRARPGVRIPDPPPAGLRFTSKGGERRFLPQTYPFEILTEEELAALPETQLTEYLQRAEREPT